MYFEVSLTDATLYALAEHSKDLERTKMRGCADFTVPAVLHLLRSCTILSILNLAKDCLSEQDKQEIKQALLPRSIKMW
jgi:hypothetical protein